MLYYRKSKYSFPRVCAFISITLFCSDPIRLINLAFWQQWATRLEKATIIFVSAIKLTWSTLASVIWSTVRVTARSRLASLSLSLLSFIIIMYGYWIQGQWWSLEHSDMKCCEKSKREGQEFISDRWRTNEKPFNFNLRLISWMKISVRKYYKEKITFSTLWNNDRYIAWKVSL